MCFLLVTSFHSLELVMGQGQRLSLGLLIPRKFRFLGWPSWRLGAEGRLSGLQLGTQSRTRPRSQRAWAKWWGNWYQGFAVGRNQGCQSAPWRRRPCLSHTSSTLAMTSFLQPPLTPLPVLGFRVNPV